LELKVVICDDEEGMRLVLKKAIEKVDGFEIVGEAMDGEDSLEIIDSLRPDIVFIDVDMPKLTGIECAKKVLDINPKIIIIFATAHEEYMSEAFSVYAFDYLVKPFKIERIFQTLNRIKATNKEHDEKAINKIIRHEKGLDKIMLKSKEGISLINMKDIILIQREDRSTVIYTKDSSYVTSDNLTELEDRLDNAQFFRCHKSYIINLSMINKIYPYGRWTYTVKLLGTDKDALLTHEKYEDLKVIFKGI
jgi:two-component system LytT family response regulator